MPTESKSLEILIRDLLLSLQEPAKWVLPKSNPKQEEWRVAGTNSPQSKKQEEQLVDVHGTETAPQRCKIIPAQDTAATIGTMPRMPLWMKYGHRDVQYSLNALKENQTGLEILVSNLDLQKISML